MWGVHDNAVRKGIRAGTIYLHPDGSVDVEASDEVWGRRHELRLALYDPDALDPATLKRIETELAEAGEWLARTGYSAILKEATDALRRD
jgi:hypothetical protein